MMPSTIRARLQFLHTALAWAVQQKLLPAVPRFPTVKVPKKKPQPVPLESFERILAKAPDQHSRTFLLAGWLAGLRLNEALHLEWEKAEGAPWVDFGRDRIVFPAEFVKADEDQWVPLDPQLREALESMPRTGRRVFCFVSRRTGRPLDDTSISDFVSKLAKKAGVKLSMHGLRRGFGCRYAGKVPAQVLQKLMRHANIKTTMDFYANVDEAVEEAVLGPQRNRKRNTPADPAAGQRLESDVTTKGSEGNG
jgi:integrase